MARLFRRYNYLAMPVVDARHRLVGLITFDDAADVIEEEATEDMQKLFARAPASESPAGGLFLSADASDGSLFGYAAGSCRP